MKNVHPAELEIQEYAADKSLCSADIKNHIDSCAGCQEEVNQYQVLFFELKKESPARFDFNLSSLVISRLPKANQGVPVDQFIAMFLVLFICSFVAVPMYIFRTYIYNMFSGISSFFVYAMIGSATAIIAYKTQEIYKKYQKQIQLLNFN